MNGRDNSEDNDQGGAEGFVPQRESDSVETPGPGPEGHAGDYLAGDIAARHMPQADLSHADITAAGRPRVTEFWQHTSGVHLCIPVTGYDHCHPSGTGTGPCTDKCLHPGFAPSVAPWFPCIVDRVERFESAEQEAEWNAHRRSPNEPE
jgi:hypothetical protein